jgi:hypothetical protein
MGHRDDPGKEYEATVFNDRGCSGDITDKSALKRDALPWHRTLRRNENRPFAVAGWQVRQVLNFPPISFLRKQMNV